MFWVNRYYRFNYNNYKIKILSRVYFQQYQSVKKKKSQILQLIMEKYIEYWQSVEKNNKIRQMIFGEKMRHSQKDFEGGGAKFGKLSWARAEGKITKFLK